MGRRIDPMRPQAPRLRRRRVTADAATGVVAAAVLLALALGAAPAAAVWSEPGTYKPDGVIEGAVWRLVPGFVYPELDPKGPWGIPSLQAKPNFGIAMSGGGYRATTLALGWARALHALGALDAARYLSTNSGGSWFNGVYSYSQVPSPILLGDVIPPQQLTLDRLRDSNGPGSYGQAVGRATIVGDSLTRAFAEALTRRDAGEIGAWSNAVGKAFLAPFGVGGHKTAVTALGTRGRVGEARARARPEVPFATACARPDKPYPIILGSVLVHEAPTKYAPIEFTPLYAGVPNVTFGADPPTGGGFVEPLLLNTFAPDPPAGVPRTAPGPITVSGDPAPYIVPLVQMVGISSSFAAQGARPESDAAAELTGAEELTLWDPVTFSGALRKFADGGGADNIAITPLLRRKVKRIVACVAASAPADANATAWAASQWDIAGLFGAVPRSVSKNARVNGMPVDVFNAFTQVFETDGYFELYDALAAAARGAPGGAPASARHLARYRVRANAAKGVEGGWQVEVLWLVNARELGFERQLPDDTRQLLADNRSGAAKGPRKKSEFKQYPYVSTFDADYTPEMVALLSQQASWQVAQAEREIRALMGGGGRKP